MGLPTSGLLDGPKGQAEGVFIGLNHACMCWNLCIMPLSCDAMTNGDNQQMVLYTSKTTQHNE